MRVMDLLEDKSLQLELAAAVPVEQLQRSVTACAQSELIDPAPYLAPGEFMLTLGMALHIRDQRTWDAYVERLTAARISGLGFGLGPIHGSAPEGLIVACERHALPLFVLDSDFPLVKLSRHIWQELASERYAIARTGWALADECTQLATEGALLPVLLGRVSAAINGNVQLLDSAGFVIAAVGGVEFPRGRATRTTLRLPGAEQARFQLQIESASETLLLQPLLGPACAVIAMQLSYTLTARSPLHSHTAARFFEAMLDPRVSGEDATRSLAATAGFTVGDEWDVVVLRRPHDGSHAMLRLATMRLRVLLEQHYDRVRFFDELEHATLLMQRPHGIVDLPAVLEVTVDGGTQIDTAFATRLRFDELSISIQAARRAPRIEGVHRIQPVDLSTILDSLPSGGLLALAKRTLSPLLDGDRALVDTLTAYLELSGSTRDVCERLFIHRNTLSYRMKRISSLLGADIDDGRTRASLLLALEMVGSRSMQIAQADLQSSTGRP